MTQRAEGIHVKEKGHAKSYQTVWSGREGGGGWVGLFTDAE